MTVDSIGKNISGPERDASRAHWPRNLEKADFTVCLSGSGGQLRHSMPQPGCYLLDHGVGRLDEAVYALAGLGFDLPDTFLTPAGSGHSEGVRASLLVDQRS
jgi:hypothetical protein